MTNKDTRKASGTLSKASVYEQMFHTRHRRSGRPEREDGDSVLFNTADVHPVLARAAQRRAYAVVHEENRGRLREIFSIEMKVLKRRGVQEVATDIGMPLPADSSEMSSSVDSEL